MRDARVTVRFSSELRQRLKAAAERTGKQESELVRAAVEKHLAETEQTETAYDWLQKAGLIGMVKRGPSDLSTNKKYFEGFGKPIARRRTR
jgi:predicted DNA-binding protein